jgi:hypothetical protein
MENRPAKIDYQFLKFAAADHQSTFISYEAQGSYIGCEVIGDMETVA